MVGPAVQRDAVAHLQAVMGLSERRACSIVGADRKMVRYRSRRPPDTELRARLRELANERRRFGYRRLFILLRREGEPSGVNRIHRLYREEGLRGAKASEGRSGHMVRPATETRGPPVGNPVGSGGVEQGSAQDREGEVHGGPSVLVKEDPIGEDPPLSVEAEGVVRGVGMAFPREGHVLPPVQAQAERAVQEPGAERGQSGPGVCVGLFPPETATQTEGLYGDQVHGEAEDPGDRLLGAPRGLGG